MGSDYWPGGVKGVAPGTIHDWKQEWQGILDSHDGEKSLEEQHIFFINKITSYDHKRSVPGSLCNRDAVKAAVAALLYELCNL